MIKNIKKIMLLMAAIFGFGASAFAQGMPQLPVLPVDSAVRIGKLPNGLTYYIRHNDTPKGQADFYIAQKVGSILEEDNQRGLAHFLEHMCFNGTTNFPGDKLIKWLESIGVKFGYNLNAYTSIDQTVYNISNVPVARKSVQDSCLLILHDWANDLTLDPAEIDKERGVIHQEWRRSMVGQMRIIENLLPQIYPGSRYGERLPIGTMEVVDNFPPQALRDYYETWYRPDQQGIIVVGDIDVDYIEGKIKEMFSSIEMPENPKERVYFEVEDTPGTIYALGSDPEQTNTIVQLMFKTDILPVEMRNTQAYLIQYYVMEMVSEMLGQRLNDMTKLPDSPFAVGGASYDNFFLSKTKDAFSIVVIPKGNDVLGSFEAVYRELLRATRGGFTPGEYERTRAQYISSLEKEYNARDNQENDYYVQQYVNNFLDNLPIMPISDEYEMMSQMSQMIPLQVLNSILPELILSDNRVLMGLFPDNGTVTMPTPEEFAAVIAKVDAEEIEPYKDAMKEEPLIPQLPAPGKVVSIVDNAQWGAKEITLSNGIKVIVKPTEFKKDEVLFNATAVGGTSTIDDSQATNLIYLPIAISEYALGDYSTVDLQKYLQGKQVNVSISLDKYSREVSGESTAKDLPTLMELIYMSFTNFNLMADEFAANQNMISSILENQAANPQYIFQKTVNENLYKSAAEQTLTSEIVMAADREAILDIVHGLLANPAEYTFYFVGDIDLDTLVPLLEQYIATLPANPAAASAKYVANPSREATPGKHDITATTKMETPQTWCLILYSAKMKYTAKDRVIASIASQILTKRLLEKIREEMGAVYSISAAGGMRRLGEFNTLIQIPFPMKPELKDEVLAEIDKMIKGMSKEITADEINPIKEFMVKTYAEDLEKNEGWLNAMTGTALNGVDTFNGYSDVINSVTAKDVEKFMKDVIKQGNVFTIILDPEQ